MSQVISMTTVTIMTDDEVRRGARSDEASFGSLATDRGHLPLRAMEVSGRITGLVSELAVRQTFVNTLGVPLEATYLFPLPDRAAVTGFRMEVKGRVIEGLIKERGEAREEYERALEAGHRAAITEEERPGVFTMRVGNLPAGEEVSVRLTLVGPLPFEDGEATFRFPLVVAPRYIPGTPLSGESVGDGTMPDTDAVPDASRITPPVLLRGYPNPVRLELSVAIDPGAAPLGDLRSSLHVVETEPRDERLARQAPWEGRLFRVALKPGERLDRDFILRFRLGDGAVRTSLALRPDREGAEGTFLLTLVPPASLAPGLPRDVIFVLDRSGSMEGWKMVAARRAVARMIDSLGPRDRFAVLAFDDVIETPPELPARELAPASDRNRFRAVEFLAGLQARGGTELAAPLELAADQLAGGYQDRDRVIVLATDGQVGNEDQILRRLGKRVKGARVFTLGIDQAVNEGFLRRLAALGAGSCELVESEDRLDEVMAKIHRRIGTPVLSELRVEPSGLELVPGTLVPARPADLFPGTPLVVLGRYRGSVSGRLGVRGRDAAGRAFSEEVHGAPSSNAALAALWARGQLRQLEDRYLTSEGEKDALERQIVETSLRFGVLSRFTAFVAVDRTEVVSPGGGQQHVVQPVEAPKDWGMFEATAAPAQTMAGTVMPRMLGLANAVFGGGAPMRPAQAPSMAAPSGPPVPRSPVPAPASASMPAPKMARMASRALPGKSEEAEKDDEGLPALDLAPYRARAAGLLASVKPGLAGAVLLEEAGRLALQLGQLLEDLASVGGPPAVQDALRPLQEELRRLVDASADERTLGEALGRALEGLRAFAEGKDDGGQGEGGKGGKRSRWAFWR